MREKKNPKVDLRRHSSLFFAVGLNVMLFLTYTAINMKSYDKELVAVNVLQLENVVEEDIPITNINTPPPPPPPKVMAEVITIVEDIAEIEETVIKSTEITMEDVIDEVEIAVDDVKVEEDIEEEVTVPFAVVEKVPIYPGCKGKTNAELKKCFEKNVIEHIKRNYQFPEAASELGIHGKVFVMFTVDQNGYVSDIKTRGPDRILENEAKRIISLLPQMTPAKQRNKSVKVPYSIPINFKYLDQ